MNFGDFDFYIIFDLFVLLLIGMGPKIALVPFLELTAEITGAHHALTQIRKGHAIVGVKAAVVVQKDRANKLSVKDIGMTPGKGAFGGVVLGP